MFEWSGTGTVRLRKNKHATNIKETLDKYTKNRTNLKNEMTTIILMFEWSGAGTVSGE